MAGRPTLFSITSVAFPLLGLWGCDSDRAREPVSPPKSSATAPAAPPDTSYRYPARERIVAFGDIHGDVSAARAALRLAGAIDDRGAWTGGTMAVVQTGDQLDRGDEEPEVLDLFEDLEAKATKAGGAFYVLDGNHEVMNVTGDFRYVTSDGFRDFRSTELAGARARAASQLPEEQRGRAATFLPGGPGALRLAKHSIAIMVGDSVFVHGGLLPGHLRYGLGRINEESRRWMRGEAQRMPEILNGDSAPVWSRDYSDGEPDARSCETLGKVLDELTAKRMVVGHTVQKQGITSGCAERVWRIDVGLARHYGGRPAVLEIRGTSVRAITAESAPAAASVPGATPGKPAAGVAARP